MHTYQRLYVGGRWVEPVGDGKIEVRDSADDSLLGSVPQGVKADADNAVAEAQHAFPQWARTPPHERLAKLGELADGIRKREDALARLMTGESGMPIRHSRRIQVGLPLQVLDAYQEIGPQIEWTTEIDNSLIRREPVGVVGCLTPWNYPLHQIICKIAPALLAGCVVVIKPSEVAPLTACVLAEVVEEVGFPPGVVNIVTGLGAEVGEALTEHPQVHAVSFTGSTRTGKMVAALAADKVKKLVLELGGKSPSVMLDDADMEQAVRSTLGSCFLNAGQTCIAWSRLLVPATQQADVESAISDALCKYQLGNPYEEQTRVGALATQDQVDSVNAMIERAKDDGAVIVAQGDVPPSSLDRGYFVRPTVLSNVDPDSEIAQEEVFGPVLSIITYTDESDALRIANGTRYGLHAGVWSSDKQRALNMAESLVSGQVDINGTSYNPKTAFGGWRESGQGRELGQYGVDEFVELKSIQF